MFRAVLITIAMLLLAQAEEAPAEAAPAAAEAPPPAPAPAAKPTNADPYGQKLPQRTATGDEVQRAMEKMQRMTPDQAAQAAKELSARLPPAPGIDDAKKIGAQPIAIPEVKDYTTLPETEQVKYSAREFFSQLIAGDARGIVGNCGFPFQLEDRRLQTPDELFQEWLKNLRAKRTDLLTLYDIEVLAPADMEKKYGKPPARLANLPWRNPKTYVAVANLSGHAAIAVFRQQGPSWAVVGYAD